jgi:hypothetical protein
LFGFAAPPAVAALADGRMLKANLIVMLSEDKKQDRRRQLSAVACLVCVLIVCYLQ